MPAPPPGGEEPGTALIARLRAGDLDALDDVYRRYGDRVFTTCRRIVGSAADAEDVTQDVFLKVLARARTFRGESSFAAWLLRIAVHEAMNFCRARDRRRRDVGSEDPDAVPGQGPRPLAALLGAEEREALDAALASLPLEQRAVVVLRELEGLSYAEIAALLDLPEGTVTSRLVRGRERLIAAVRHRLPDGEGPAVEPEPAARPRGKPSSATDGPAGGGCP